MQAERIIPVTVVQGVVTSGVPAMVVGSPMGAVQFVADLPGPSRIWSATGLPPGLSFDAAGLLSGTPAEVGVTDTTFSVDDGGA